MNDLGNNKLLYVVVGLVGLFLVIGLGGKYMVDRVADRVIQKMQKEYSPSPYGPGFDPDKVDPQRMVPPPPAQKANWEGWEKGRS